MFEQLQHILQSSGFLLPDEIFAGFLILLVTYITFSKKLDEAKSQKIFNIFLVGILLSFCFVFYAAKLYFDTHHKGGISLFSQLVYLDDWAYFFKILILLAAIFVLIHIIAMGHQLESEFYVFFLAIILGLLLLTMTTNLLMLYLALEFVSISSYILVAYNRQKHNMEAGIKYLLFGAISSAIMLYGMSWLYGLTGTLDFTSKVFVDNLAANPNWVVILVSLMTTGGMLFKLSSAPFHVWTPDVYEATPTPIVAFLSIAPKAAALLAFTRFLSTMGAELQLGLGIIIIISITIGNFSALWQTNVKRMLGYSTIAHSGFMLVGILAMSQVGIQTSVFYVATYLFITLAAFLLIDIIAEKTGNYELESYVGIGQNNIFLGIASVVIMIALVGLPPTIGFSAKLLVFSALWDTYQQTNNKILLLVLIIGLLNTAVSIFYYLKIPYFMIIKTNDNSERNLQTTYFQNAVLVFFVLVILYLFFAPNDLLQLIEGI